MGACWAVFEGFTYSGQVCALMCKFELWLDFCVILCGSGVFGVFKVSEGAGIINSEFLKELVLSNGVWYNDLTVSES